jgi:transcription antitermination factor NusG
LTPNLRLELFFVKLNNALNQQHWYVVRTANNAESKTAQRLHVSGLTVFLPLYETLRQWSDRKKKVSLPLIPSTLFVYCTETELNKVYPVPGVAGVLRYLGKPAVVQDWEIENLRIVLKELYGQHIEAVDEPYVPGDHVRVVRGPFKGLYGTSVECDGKHRLLITIDSIGAAFTVSVPRSFVKKINEQQIA